MHRKNTTNPTAWFAVTAASTKIRLGTVASVLVLRAARNLQASRGVGTARGVVCSLHSSSLLPRFAYRFSFIDADCMTLARLVRLMVSACGDLQATDSKP